MHATRRERDTALSTQGSTSPNSEHREMQRPDPGSSSEEGSPDEVPAHLSNHTAMQELRQRINHSAAPHSSSSDSEDNIGSASSSDFEGGYGSEVNDDQSDDDGNGQDADIPIGERIASLVHGPIARRKSRSHTRHVLSQPKGIELRDDRQSGATGNQVDQSEGIKRRVNKHAPVEEQISKRPVSVMRDAVQKKSVKPQDPRFLGWNKPESQREADLARRRYGFLYDQAIPAEVKELKAAMRKSTDASEQRRLQVKLSRLQQSLKQHEDRSLELEVESEWKKSQRSKIEAGKTPYYLKESEKKKRVLEKKFARLEETGQLDKYMTKKRKRQASKVHKKLPFRRKHE